MNHSLKDVVSIVAGLTQPLEIEIIRSLLKQEAIVIVPASNTDTILQIKNEVADIATGTLITLINDPLDYDRSRDITDHIEQNYGRIDLVIVLSNQVYSPHPLTQLDYTTWDTMQCDSLSYCFMAARLILPLMMRHQRGTFIQVCNSLPEGLHRSPLNRIAGTLQEEVSKILHEEVSGHGVQYYHVFSNMENQKTDRTKEAAYILQLFKDSTSQDKQLFHQAYGKLDTSLLSGHHLN